MGALLEALQCLQEIERDLNRLRQKEGSYQRLIRNNQRQIDRNHAEHEEHLQQIKKCQMEIDQADLNIKSIEEAMGKHRQALNQAKSNKEYAAILTALNTEKADGAKLENRVLELMGEKEKLENTSKDFQEKHDKLQARLKKSQADLAAFLEKNKQRFDDLDRKRVQACENLPPQALSSFERVSQKHDGEALGEVIKIDARRDDHVCGGCNMSLPLEHVSALKARDEMQLCPTCGRILYIGDAQTAEA